MSIVIKAENISKQYRLGLIGSGSIRDDMSRWWNKLQGKEDVFSKVGEENIQSETATSKYVWSLKDINFEIKQGDVVGVIGKNGAGKSTLLKILSKITAPTTGTIKIKGRIASLLEVGTGFHPELTGRENIYLNGAIMGMTKAEITRKFDEIVNFSGVERYIDTPVKRYSSGMYVRLAFAVAAHLEPEILIIDEVLAVGDADFQKKCLGKMKDISSNEGRTIIFVSHNLQAVSNLCNSGILLKNGTVAFNGNIEDCIKNYIVSSRVSNLSSISLKDRLARTNGNVLFEEVHGFKNGNECWDFNFDEEIVLKFKVIAQVDTDDLGFYIALRDPFTQEIITNYKTVITDTKLLKGESKIFYISLPPKILRPGQYGLYLALSNREIKIFYDVLDDNVNIPFLNINPSSMDIHENSGFLSAPFKLITND